MSVFVNIISQQFIQLRIFIVSWQLPQSILFYWFYSRTPGILEQFHAEISCWIPAGFRVDSDRIPSYFSEWVGFLLGMLD
jgi:hypothetical protein